MPKKSSSKIFTILVGGQAGDGAREATANLARLLAKLGYEIFISVEYPSLIRGGHNFSRLSFSAEKIYSDSAALDILVALNRDTVERHAAELKKDAVVIYGAPMDKTSAGQNLVAMPLADWAKELSAPPLARISAALGAVCFYFGLPLSKLDDVFQEVFKDKAEPNIKLAKHGYDHFKKLGLTPLNLPAAIGKAKPIFDGNEAFAEGLVKAGLKNYFAYPMTPSSSILHYLAKQAKNYNLKVVQPENEIAAINMALGSAITGAPTAVASSCGGFALMLEAMCMAGNAEIPIVAADSQRAGVSTGVPTRAGQGDLNFVRFLPGEFPRLILAPGDAEESFLCGGWALEIAWRCQTPAVVLLDKHLSESSTTCDFETDKIKKAEAKEAKPGPDYKRYALTADGISPLAFPGDKDTVVKYNSYEHDENGFITDAPEMAAAMQEKRFAKNALILKEMKKRQPLKIYGDRKAKEAIVFWGSPKGAILEALKLIPRPLKVIQFICLEPFDSAGALKELFGLRRIIDIENNFTAPLAGLLREQTGVAVTDKILRYDSLPFEPTELAKKLNEIF